MNNYSNIPNSKIPNSSDATVKIFDNYYSAPLELHAGTFAAMIGFFTARGFDERSAESTAVVIIRQAKQDGYNPMQILDTLKGLDSVEISALVAEIINYNRFKTSYLGYALRNNPNYEIQRNIIEATPSV